MTHLNGQIVDILRSRSLQSATLDEVLYATAGRLRTGIAERWLEGPAGPWEAVDLAGVLGGGRPE